MENPENPEQMGKLLSFEEGKNRIKKGMEHVEDKRFQKLAENARLSAMKRKILEAELNKPESEQDQDLITDLHDAIYRIDEESEKLLANGDKEES